MQWSKLIERISETTKDEDEETGILAEDFEEHFKNEVNDPEFDDCSEASEDETEIDILIKEEEYDEEDFNQTINATVADHNSQIEEWKRDGMDKILESFCVKDLEVIVAPWIQNKTIVEEKYESRSKPRTKTNRVCKSYKKKNGFSPIPENDDSDDGICLRGIPNFNPQKSSKFFVRNICIKDQMYMQLVHESNCSSIIPFPMPSGSILIPVTPVSGSRRKKFHSEKVNRKKVSSKKLSKTLVSISSDSESDKDLRAEIKQKQSLKKKVCSKKLPKTIVINSSDSEVEEVSRINFNHESIINSTTKPQNWNEVSFNPEHIVNSTTKGQRMYSDASLCNGKQQKLKRSVSSSSVLDPLESGTSSGSETEDLRLSKPKKGASLKCKSHSKLQDTNPLPSTKPRRSISASCLNSQRTISSKSICETETKKVSSPSSSSSPNETLKPRKSVSSVAAGKSMSSVPARISSPSLNRTLVEISNRRSFSAVGRSISEDSSISKNKSSKASSSKENIKTNNKSKLSNNTLSEETLSETLKPRKSMSSSAVGRTLAEVSSSSSRKSMSSKRILSDTSQSSRKSVGRTLAEVSSTSRNDELEPIETVDLNSNTTFMSPKSRTVMNNIVNTAKKEFTESGSLPPFLGKLKTIKLESTEKKGIVIYDPKNKEMFSNCIKSGIVELNAEMIQKFIGQTYFEKLMKTYHKKDPYKIRCNENKKLVYFLPTFVNEEDEDSSEEEEDDPITYAETFGYIDEV